MEKSSAAEKTVIDFSEQRGYNRIIHSLFPHSEKIIRRGRRPQKGYP